MAPIRPLIPLRPTIVSLVAALALVTAASTACGAAHQKAAGSGPFGAGATSTTAVSGGRVGRAPPAVTPSTSTAATRAAPSTTIPPLRVPAPVPPLALPALAGEGAWLPAGDRLPGGYAVYTTHLRPAPGYPEVGLAWIDSAATRLNLYAGTSEPSGSWPHQGTVEAAIRPFLLAAFNSGFRIYNYRTGWSENGVSAEPLQAGAASLAIFADGHATVGAWGTEVGPASGTVAVRQNLSMLIDHGTPTATVDTPSAWGAVLGGGSVTWRSGVGVTAAGDLVYAGGPSLTPRLLAGVLLAAGVVRAMEMDINPEWVSFVAYSHPAGLGGASLVGSVLDPGMWFGPDHYLTADSRDFLAVFAR